MRLFQSHRCRFIVLLFLVFSGCTQGFKSQFSVGSGVARIPGSMINPVTRSANDPLSAKLLGPFTLQAGESVTVGALNLIFQADGNLALYRNGRFLWGANNYSSWTSRDCHTGCFAAFQTDGNLALYKDGVFYWGANAGGDSGDQIRLADSAPFLTIVNGDSIRWVASPVFDPFILQSENSIRVGNADLRMQADGNLALYSDGQFLWGANAQPGWTAQNCAQNCFAQFQTDGNLVLYNNGVAYWAIENRGHVGDQLVISSTAPFVRIQTPTKESIFATSLGLGTCGTMTDKTHSVYVSPTGTTAGLGTVNDPASLDSAPALAARKVQALTAAGSAGPVCVFLRGGTYVRSTPLTILPEHSGTSQSPVIFTSFPGEQAMISGAEPVVGWTFVSPGLIRASTSLADFRQLYINGERAIRARAPHENNSFSIIQWDAAAQRIYVNPSDMCNPTSADWHGVEMIVNKTYDMSILRIKSAAPYQHPTLGNVISIEIEAPESNYAFTQGSAGVAGDTYHFENSCGFLDAEGTWCLDLNTHFVYYRLKPGESVANLQVSAPAIESLVSVRGAATSPVSYVQFTSLGFTGTTWTAPSQTGFVGKQAGIFQTGDDFGAVGLPPAAVFVENGNQTAFTGNQFQNLGAIGILFYKNVNDSRISSNQFRGISSIGIAVDGYLPLQYSSSFWSAEQISTAEVSRRNSVSFNRLEKFGLDYIGSVGIFGGYTDNLRVEYNEVSSAPYTGISVGWGWRLNESPARNNLILGNHVHDVMRMSVDGGGVYTLGRQPESAIARNYVHSIYPTTNQPYSRVGIYLDQGSSFIRVFDNVASDVAVKVNDNYAFDPAGSRHNEMTNNDSADPEIMRLSGPGF